MIRVTNRGIGPKWVDFGPPLGLVRVPKSVTLDLDVDSVETLKLPPHAARMVRRGDLQLENAPKAGSSPKPAVNAPSGDRALASATPAVGSGPKASTPTAAHPKAAPAKKGN